MAQFTHFIVLLVVCGTEDSLETTTSPKQQNTGDTKDLCEVQSWLSFPDFKEINLLIMIFKCCT